MTVLVAWLPIINVVGIVALGLTIVFLRIREGAATVSKDVINTYKTRVEQLEENEKVARQRSVEHTKEIGQLQGALGEKEKEINRLRLIVENRNPELTAVLQEIRDFMRVINTHMETHEQLMQAVPQFVKP